MTRATDSLVLALLLGLVVSAGPNPAVGGELLAWHELPALPNALGVAGPFAGVHNDALIVAGGANFPRPVWENDKVWLDRVHVLTKSDGRYEWKDGGRLPRAIAYGAAVSTADGVVCIGGNNANDTFGDVILLQWDRVNEQITTAKFPSLPRPCAYGSAAIVNGVIYVAGGQSGSSIATAMTNFWSLDLSQRHSPEEFRWRELPPWPGPSRAFNMTVRQHNGFSDCVYVLSGRRESDANETELEFLRDVWEYTPEKNAWRQRSDAPRSVMAGTAAGTGQSHILVLGGADGSLFSQADVLRDNHPGFPTEALAYHTITDSWTSAGSMPQNHVTTIAVDWGGTTVVPSGEVRPRVRSPRIWAVRPSLPDRDFGAINYVVLFGYLLSMVAIGIYFTKRTATPTITSSAESRFPGGRPAAASSRRCLVRSPSRGFHRKRSPKIGSTRSATS